MDDSGLLWQWIIALSGLLLTVLSKLRLSLPHLEYLL